MNTKQFQKYLLGLNACADAVEWAKGKTLKQVWETCERGDWMLWLIAKSKLYDLKTITGIKVDCAELVRHLMKDERSTNALDVAKRFSQGKATRKELDTAADAAYAYAYAAYASAAAIDARTKTLKQCADICRKHIPNIKIAKQ